MGVSFDLRRKVHASVTEILSRDLSLVFEREKEKEERERERERRERATERVLCRARR